MDTNNQEYTIIAIIVHVEVQPITYKLIFGSAIKPYTRAL